MKKNKRLQGVIVSDKMNKTRVVKVVYSKMHKKYLKQYTITRRFKAHDEKNESRLGDSVIIQETRPLSKDKKWFIVGRI